MIIAALSRLSLENVVGLVLGDMKLAGPSSLRVIAGVAGAILLAWLLTEATMSMEIMSLWSPLAPLSGLDGSI